MGTPRSPAELPRWLFATTLTLSVALVLTVLVASVVVRNRPPDPVRLAAIPAPEASSAQCARLLRALPAELEGGLPRRDLTDPGTGQDAHDGVAAWGSPAVVLYCGLDRPAEFTLGSPLLDVSGVQFLELGGDEPDHRGARGDPAEVTASTWVVVDRPVYVAVTLPPQVGSGPLQHLAELIDRTLPPQDLDPRRELPR